MLGNSINQKMQLSKNKIIAFKIDPVGTILEPFFRRFEKIDYC
jgi:hypothetical protein